MSNSEVPTEILTKILQTLDAANDTKFYNEPIFLALISIIFGGIALNLITKHIEHRSKKRDMAITFINEVADILNDVLSSIAGYRKRKLFGKDITDSLEKKRGRLFYSLFSFQVKSKAYLDSTEFFEKYKHLIYKIDLLIYYYKKNDENSIDSIDVLIKNIEEFWPIDEEITHLQMSDNLVHQRLILLERMLWIRANSLVTQSLDNVI